MDMEMKDTGKRLPTIIEALIPIAFMMCTIIWATVKWGMDPHVPLVLATIVAAIVAYRCGYRWDDIAFGMLDSIKRTVEALLIILCVGMLIGSWVWSGTMPAMVYYGLDIIAPGAFLVVGCILCAIVGLATGSSWTASGTVGFLRWLSTAGSFHAVFKDSVSDIIIDKVIVV